VNDPTFIATGIIQFLVLLFSLSVHEWAHAATAYWMGDDTAALQGRMTISPVAHIDPIGTILFPLMGIFGGGVLFGWAKPVPTNPVRFRKFRAGQILVAAAGPASNIAQAILFLLLWAVYVNLIRPIPAFPGRPDVIHYLCLFGVQINIILAAFNILPLTPLDGSWIASNGLPRKWGRWYDERIAPYGPMILIGLLMLSFTGFRPLGLYFSPFLAAGHWLLGITAS